MKTRPAESPSSAVPAPRTGARTALDALPGSFYERPVLEVARDLIGCTVVHGETAGVIVETEAYHQQEPASHAYIGLTPRTSTLFGPPGVAYVYRSYGIHALFNAVCEPEGVGAAVLIRALRPVAGLELMRRRRSRRPRADEAEAGSVRSEDGSGARAMADRELCSGPGRLAQALGIELGENGTSLVRGPVRVLPRERRAPEIVASTRIGITKAAALPWRFSLAGDENVSRPWPSRSG
ncbi:MAG TPA: DNA-3-methyladenine glycosylase [Solirubrobacteraceae bacterium]